MLGRRRKLAELAFSAGILKSFGKLNQQDIDAIDGCPERLVRQLINQYGWTRDAAQDRVEASFECRPKARKRLECDLQPIQTSASQLEKDSGTNSSKWPGGCFAPLVVDPFSSNAHEE